MVFDKEKNMKYPNAFKKAVNHLLENEGGYSNDPDDPGGETNFGICRRQYPDLDIKNLTKEKAVEIYYEDYWSAHEIDLYPRGLQEIIFDMTVNFGSRGGVKVVQEAANNKNSHQIKVDGLLGPETLRAVKSLEVDRIKAFRVLRFAKICISNPDMYKYWYGWFRRATK